MIAIHKRCYTDRGKTIWSRNFLRLFSRMAASCYRRRKQASMDCCESAIVSIYQKNGGSYFKKYRKINLVSFSSLWALPLIGYLLFAGLCWSHLIHTAEVITEVQFPFVHNPSFPQHGDPIRLSRLYSHLVSFLAEGCIAKLISLCKSFHAIFLSRVCVYGDFPPKFNKFNGFP